MCDCKVGWITDESVVGSHNRKPVTCREYIGQLEAAVVRLERASDGLSADSLMLTDIQKACGISR